MSPPTEVLLSNRRIRVDHRINRDTLESHGEGVEHEREPPTFLFIGVLELPSGLRLSVTGLPLSSTGTDVSFLPSMALSRVGGRMVSIPFTCRLPSVRFGRVFLGSSLPTDGRSHSPEDVVLRCPHHTTSRRVSSTDSPELALCRISGVTCSGFFGSTWYS